MKIPDIERYAISHVIAWGGTFGYGNLISHLRTAWAKSLMDNCGFDEKAARHVAGTSARLHPKG